MGISYKSGLYISGNFYRVSSIVGFGEHGPLLQNDQPYAVAIQIIQRIIRILNMAGFDINPLHHAYEKEFSTFNRELHKCADDPWGRDMIRGELIYGHPGTTIGIACEQCKTPEMVDIRQSWCNWGWGLNKDKTCMNDHDFVGVFIYIITYHMNYMMKHPPNLIHTPDQDHIDLTPVDIFALLDRVEAAQKIKNWWKYYQGLKQVRKHDLSAASEGSPMRRKIFRTPEEMRAILYGPILPQYNI